jgi:Leucine-rich repeat (LRR) protein
VTDFTPFFSKILTLNLDDFLGQFPNLTTLELFYPKLITDVGISELTNLKSLKLIGTKITDIGLKKLKNLTDLRLTNNKVLDTGIEELTNITSLDLTLNHLITDYGLRNLRNLTKITTLYLTQYSYYKCGINETIK